MCEKGYKNDGVLYGDERLRGLERRLEMQRRLKYFRKQTAKGDKTQNDTVHKTLEEIPEDLSSLLNNGSSPDDEIKNAVVQGSFEELSNDLRSLLLDAPFSDVTVKSGTKCMKVHKSILSARSPVFKSIFRNSTGDSVSIDDLDNDAFRNLMSFIYCNQVQNLSAPTACDLLVAAKKYQLQSLKCICIDYLMKNLSAEYVFLILQKADLSDEKELKMHAMDFIRKNIFYLKGFKEWRDLQVCNPALACEVFNMVVEDLAGNST